MRDGWRGDQSASDVAMQGEHRLARIRLLVVGAPTLLGLLVVAYDPQNVGYVRAIPINLVCLALAIAVLFATRTGQRPTWRRLRPAISGSTSMPAACTFTAGRSA